jgi:hypothetical protein
MPETPPVECPEATGKDSVAKEKTVHNVERKTVENIRDDYNQGQFNTLQFNQEIKNIDNNQVQFNTLQFNQEIKKTYLRRIGCKYTIK